MTQNRKIGRLPGFRAIGSDRESGAQIAEAAVVLPVLFLVIIAIFWFGLAFNVAATVERAAKLGAIVAARPTCASCTNAFPASATVVTAIQNSLRAGHLDPANVIANAPAFACTPTIAPVCTTASGVEICDGVPLTCGTAACQTPPVGCGVNAQFGMRVSFGYRFKSPVPVGSFTQITIPASAQAQKEN